MKNALLDTAKIRKLLVTCIGCIWLGNGCATVKPWQRGSLADYTMRADRDPLAEMLADHVYFTREASSGGRSVGGGGCGCN